MTVSHGVEQIHQGSVLIDDPMPLPCVDALSEQSYG